MASKVKELAKSRTECAEKEATIVAMKIDIQTLNKAIEEAKNKVQNSEQEVGNVDCKLKFTLISYIPYPNIIVVFFMGGKPGSVLGVNESV